MEVDGATAHVRGEGSTLLIEADDPADLLRALGQAAGPKPRGRLAAVADGLASQGASVRLEGPSGPMLTLGADADSRGLRLLTGTRYVEAASVGAAISLIGGALEPGRRRLAFTAVALVAGATSIVIGSRRASARRRATR